MTDDLLVFIPSDRQRKAGGGRKKTEVIPQIKELLTALIETHKAGSPTESDVYWASLNPYAIAKLFEEQHNIKISNGLVKRLLKEFGYGYRKQTNKQTNKTISLR